MTRTYGELMNKYATDLLLADDSFEQDTFRQIQFEFDLSEYLGRAYVPDDYDWQEQEAARYGVDVDDIRLKGKEL